MLSKHLFFSRGAWHRLGSVPEKALQVDELDLQTRIKLLNLVFECVHKLGYFTQKKLLKSMKTDFFVMDYRTDQRNIYRSIHIVIKSGEWYQVYDLMEFILKQIARLKGRHSLTYRRLSMKINTILEDENTAFRLCGTHILISPELSVVNQKGTQLHSEVSFLPFDLTKSYKLDPKQDAPHFTVLKSKSRVEQLFDSVTHLKTRHIT